MINLSQYIYDLLQSHECVVIPGLGGFIVRKKNAVIYAAQNLFAPPSKHLLFNSQLTHNDGLLAHYITINNHVSYEQSLLEIDNFVNDILYQLYKGESFTFKDIGTLSSQNGFLKFESSEKLNIQEESYGLNSFIMPLVKTNVRQKRSVSIEKPQERRKKVIVKSYQIAAIIAFLLLSAATYFTQNETIQSHLKSNIYPHLSTFLVDNFSSEDFSSNLENEIIVKDHITFIENDHLLELEAYAHPANSIANFFSPEEVIEKANADEGTIEMSLDISAIEESTFIESSKSLIQSPVTGQYYIIIGSFQQENLAEKLCLQMKERGYNSAGILDIHPSRYKRVSLQNFEDSCQAQQYLKEIQHNLQQDAWILKW